MQPDSGGFLEATPLTSFVVMSLASIGQSDHPVVRKGVEFLLASVRPDGSWPIDTNLATWNTTLAVNALAGSGEDVRELAMLRLALACQQRQPHPYTGAAPGGWAWTDLQRRSAGRRRHARRCWRLQPGESPTRLSRERIVAAAADGVGWLLDLQNRDGGWPTFCRGWGTMPFDRSGCDLTAHALRALHAWRSVLADTSVTHARRILPETSFLSRRRPMRKQASAIGSRRPSSGFRFLAARQHADGYWIPLWFGNQYQTNEENPVYGTAKVLAAYRDFDRLATAPARRGLDWLATAGHVDGRWGGLGPQEPARTPKRPTSSKRPRPSKPC